MSLEFRSFVAMDTAIIVACISGGVGIIAASLSYIFSKIKDREADRRKLMVENYKEFLAAVSGITASSDNSHFSTENQKRFSDACNTLVIVASQKVVSALYEFQNETKAANADTLTDERHDALLTALIFAIREDLGIKNKDFNEGFSFHLWSKG
jgi:hypothetical protein